MLKTDKIAGCISLSAWLLQAKRFTQVHLIHFVTVHASMHGFGSAWPKLSNHIGNNFDFIYGGTQHERLCVSDHEQQDAARRLSVII